MCHSIRFESLDSVASFDLEKIVIENIRSPFLALLGEEKIKWKALYFASAIDDPKLRQGKQTIAKTFVGFSIGLNFSAENDNERKIHRYQSNADNKHQCTEQHELCIRNCFESVWNWTQVNGIEHRVSRDICAADSLIVSTRKSCTNRYLVVDGQNNRRQQRATRERETCPHCRIFRNHASFHSDIVTSKTYLFIHSVRLQGVSCECNMHESRDDGWPTRRKICVTIRQPSEIWFSVARLFEWHLFDC